MTPYSDPYSKVNRFYCLLLIAIQGHIHELYRKSGILKSRQRKAQQTME